MNDKLYNEYASCYAAVTNDRDFEGQLACILQTFENQNPCKSMLELFAGQASHSIAATRKDIDVWAIDASSGMKQIAVTDGFKNPDHYVIGALPSIILAHKELPKYDCILCLYHSLSNLTNFEVYELLTHAKDLLNPGGKIFIELHDIHYVMRYIAEPVIRFNEVKGKNGEVINYAWPSGKINWPHGSYAAEVPVTVIIRAGKKVERINFTSTDHIYSAEDILFIARLLGYTINIRSNEQLWQQQFGNSIILELLQD